MASLQTTYATHNVPRAISQFSGFVGEDALQRAYKRLRAKFSDRSFCSEDLALKYAVPVTIAEIFRNYKRYRTTPRLDTTTLAALTFITSVVEASKHLSTAGKHRLRACTIKALAPSEDPRPFVHELRAAFSLAQNGWDIEFTDLEGRGQFDFTVRKGRWELAVECKTITRDIGNPIHLEDFENFANRFLREPLNNPPIMACWSP